MSFFPNPFDPIAKRNRSSSRRSFGSGSGLRFPLDLGSEANERMIKFNFYEYSKTSIDQFEMEHPTSTVQLMLPPELSHGDSLEYNDFDGGIEAGAVSRYDGSLNFDYELSMDALGNFGRNFAQVSNLGVAQAMRTIAGNAVNIADVQTGRTLNPRVMSKFERVGFKTYQFNWIMIAKDEMESHHIKGIVNEFRRNAHPELISSGDFFKFPQVVKFEFLPSSEYLWEPEPCAITGVNVTYNSSGTPKFFKDTHAPLEVVLSVQLKELLVKTQGDF